MFSGWSVGLQCVVIDCERACFFSEGVLYILGWRRHPAFSGTLGKAGGGLDMVDKDPSYAAMARSKAMRRAQSEPEALRPHEFEPVHALDAKA